MSLQALLESLQKDYIASFPQKCENLQTHIDARDIGALRDDFHKLKGTGKTYGLPEVSELAALVERILIDETNAAPDEGLKAASQAVDVLRKIHAARSQQRPFELESSEEFARLRKLLRTSKAL